MVGYPSQLVVWNPLCLDPSNGVVDLESVCTGCSLVLGLLGYSCWLVAAWCELHCFLNPSDGVFGRFDLAALLRLPHLKFLFVLVVIRAAWRAQVYLL